MKITTTLHQWFPQIELPIIMAPMFLVTNKEMMKAAAQAKILGCIPAHNFRKLEDFKQCLLSLKKLDYPFGVNLIVNQSNPMSQKQLKICCEVGVSFIITSLGSPTKVIQAARPKGIKVLCDVTDIHYAEKVLSEGADGLVAVSSAAGGHLGQIPSSLLIPRLREITDAPIIAAGSVATGSALLSMLALGACGASIGSPFIATLEAPVGHEYKQACIDYGAEDIAVSTKLSGTPCTVIQTPYLKKIGLTQNPVERLLSRNKKLKKYVKMLTFYRGMKLLEKAAFQASYQTVWCAGQSIEFSRKILSIAELVKSYQEQLTKAQKEFNQLFK